MTDQDLTIIDRKTGETLTESSDPERLSDHYAILTEDLETLEKKREETDSLSETVNLLDHSRDFLSSISSDLEDLSDFGSFFDPSDLEDLKTETDRSLYSLTAVSETSDLEYLCQTPIIVSEYYCLETLKTGDRLLTAVLRLEKTKDLTVSLTESLTVNLASIEKISDSLSLQSREYGLSETLSQIIDDLISFKDQIDQVSESLTLYSQDLKTRSERLTIRYYLLKDTKTGDRLSESLKERVSVSFLDSGGYPKYDPETGHYIGSSQGYGRHFEKNTLRDFESEDPVSVCLSFGLEISFSVYHFLKDCLEYDPILDSLFLEYSETPDNDSDSWISLRDQYMDDLSSVFSETGEDLTGLYGDSDPMTINSYNGESLLSQVILYTYFEIDQKTGVFLSIHNGSDVRGGYTRPVMYMARDQYSPEKILMNDLYIYCQDPETGKETVSFWSDDCHNLYTDHDQILDQTPYDFRTRSDDLKIYIEKDSLKEKISDLESLIMDLVDYGDPETDDLRLASLLRLRDKKTKDLEDLEKMTRHRRSLTLSDFRTLDVKDLEYMDSEELTDHYMSNDPVIYYDSERPDRRPSLSGLGDLYFSY